MATQTVWFSKFIIVNPCSTFVVEPFSPGGGDLVVVRNYETIFILNPNIDEEKTKALVEKFKTLIETSAELESLDEWGKRRLAYPINYLNEGYYVLVNFKANAEFPHELERVYKITDEIIRYIVIKKD